MKLTVKQTKALDALEDTITNEVIFGGGAGGAKSVLGCYWLLKSAFKYSKTRWVMGRSRLKTLKETTLNSFFWVCQQQGITSDLFNYNQQSNIITFKNKSEILLKDLFSYPSDPNFDELGSLEVTGVFVDECNQVNKKAWEITKSRIRYNLDKHNLIPKILGTCNPAKNWVYADFYKPYREDLLPANKRFIQALVDDNPYIDPHYRQSLANLDKNSKERLLYGNWEYDDDPASLISIEAISDVFTNRHIENGETYITADIARYGDDNTVIVVWSGLRAEQIIIRSKQSIVETANEIRALSAKYQVPLSRVISDDDGLGGGVRDIIHCKGFINNARPKHNENFTNLKSQCYFKLADIIKEGKLYVNCAVEVRELLTEELEQVKQKDMDKDSKKAVMGKDKVKEMIGRSPDIADALMMRMYYELKQKHHWETFSIEL